jgi:hypothetical protein
MKKIISLCIVSSLLLSAFLTTPIAYALGSAPLTPNEICQQNNQGYWLLGADGGIFTYGDAPFFGSTGNIKLKEPVVGMTATPDGLGYWLVASDGGVFTFGNAPFLGSTGNLNLRAPITSIRSTATGLGYWLFAKDGGVFTFGDATYLGTPLNSSYYPFTTFLAADGGSLVDPITFEKHDGYAMLDNLGFVQVYGAVSILGSPYFTQNNNKSKYVELVVASDALGYWIAREDGSVYTFGNATFYGSAGATNLFKPIVSMISNWEDDGYRLVGADGGIFTYGNVLYCGSTGGTRLNAPIVDAVNAGYTKYYQLFGTPTGL